MSKTDKSVGRGPGTQRESPKARGIAGHIEQAEGGAARKSPQALLPTSTHSNGFCIIRVCISSSSSSQQATAFLENAAPQHRTPRTSANNHLRTAPSLYTCPAIILAGAWQLTKTTISSALWVVRGRWLITDAPWTRPQQAAAPFCPCPFSSPHPPEPLPSHTTQALPE